MRLVVLIPVLCLLFGGCVGPGTVDWQTWTVAAKSVGLIRTERAPDDAPYDSETLARNFRTIAFEVEADPLGGGLSNQTTSGILQRWQDDIIYVIHGVETERGRIQGRVDAYAKKLQGLTGLKLIRGIRAHERAPDQPAPNMVLIAVPEDLDPLLYAMHPDHNEDIDEDGRTFAFQVMDFVVRWHGAETSPCAGQLYAVDNDRPEAGQIMHAIIVIRAGLPDIVLDMCVEEEIAQTMGLLNDDPGVRPSIFNDDQEFARLTEHDEMLIRILYDTRLEAGMTVDTAMPLVEEISRELVPGG